MSNCIHCHDQIIHEPISDNQGNLFCCNGCKQVYNVIHEVEGLDFYYSLLEAEKATAPTVKSKESTLLDRIDDAVWVNSLGSLAGEMHSLSLYSSDIHCSACGWLLETVLKKQFPALQVYVDFFKGVMDLTYDQSRYALKDIVLYCKNFGYSFEAVTKGDGRQSVNIAKPLLIRLAISGAIFANIMIFSLGIYFGMFSGIEPEWVTLFSWYSLFLSVPVVTYCAYPFYQKAFEGLRRGVLHMDLPVAIGVVCAFIVSLYLTLIGYHGYYDSVSGLVFFLLIGRWGIQKFERSLVLDSQWFEGLKNDIVKKMTEQGIQDTPIDQVLVGDQLVVFPNEYIPIDGTLKTPLTWVDKSLLTGETAIERLHAGTPLFAGFKNLKEKIILQVSNVESKDRVAELQRQFDTMIQEKNRNRDAIEKIVPWFIGAVLFFAVITFMTHYESGIENALLYATSVLVVSCPCALALARPLTYGLALKRLSGIGIFSKKHEIIDDLQKVSAVLFDKTGTLTVTERTIESWEWYNDHDPSMREQYYAAIYAAVSQSWHSVSLSIKKSIDEYNVPTLPIVGTEEFHELVGVGLYLKGVVDTDAFELFILGRKVVSPSFDLATIHAEEERDAIARIRAHYNTQVPGGDTLIVVNGVIVAGISFNDTVKPGVSNVISYLNEKKVSTVLVSGDVNYQVKELQKTIPFSAVYGEQSPEDKYSILQEYQRQGAVVAIGDGFNDSLFVASADVGIVVKGGADYLGEGADILLISQSFNRFANLFHIAQRAGVGVKRSYTVSILYNLFAISLALTGYISPLWAAILMPLSSLSIACIALITVRYYD